MAKTERVFNPKTGNWENCGTGYTCKKHVHNPQAELEKINLNSNKIIDSIEHKTPTEFVDDMLAILDSRQAAFKKAQEDWEESHKRGTEALAKLHNFTVEEYDIWLDNNKLNPDKGITFSISEFQGVINNARYSTWEGHLVEVNAESDETGPYTEINYYIGETQFKTISIPKHFSSKNSVELEEAIDSNKPF